MDTANEPFGEIWKEEMMRLSKEELIQTIKEFSQAQQNEILACECLRNIVNSKDVPSEIVDFVNKNFWDLI